MRKLIFILLIILNSYFLYSQCTDCAENIGWKVSFDEGAYIDDSLQTPKIYFNTNYIKYLVDSLYYNAVGSHIWEINGTEKMRLCDDSLRLNTASYFYNLNNDPDYFNFIFERALSQEVAGRPATVTFINKGEVAGTNDYQNETHIVLQAGTSSSHRRYINFRDYDSTTKWLFGVNAQNRLIMFNNEDQTHHFFGETNANGGNFYFNAATNGTMIINDDPYVDASDNGLLIMDGTGGKYWHLKETLTQYSGSSTTGFSVNQYGDIDADTAAFKYCEISESNPGGDVNMKIKHNNGTNGNTASLLFGITTGDGNYGQIKVERINVSNSKMYFSTLQTGILIETIIIDDTGNVGINTSTPTQELDVNGDVNVADSTFLNNNLRIKYDASNYTDLYTESDGDFVISTTGDSSKILKNILKIGDDFLWNGTTLDILDNSTYYNIFIGQGSGNSSVTGSLNTCLGLGVGENLTSGGYNTLMGQNAGNTLTTGLKNVIIGSGSILSTTTKNTVIIGSHTGSTPAKGDSCVFIGFDAGDNETGANKLYIENSNSSSPLIYGEFDNDYIKINGVLSHNNPHIYAGFDDSTVTIACTQNVWAQITNTGDSLFRYVEKTGWTIEDDTIYFHQAGDYEIYFNLSFSGNNGETWKIRSTKNDGSESTVGFNSQRYTSNNDVGNVSNNVYGDFAVDDKLYFQIMNITDNDDCVVRSASIIVKYYQ